MKLSIVATLYKSDKYIEEFCQRVSRVARLHAGDSYEIVLVNDGSPDSSIDIAMSLAHDDSHIVVVDLSRNFGHHKAMMTGLSYSQGDFVFLIDSDLEEDPEWLAVFFENMNNLSCDVVYGVQEKRKGGWFERLSGYFFYKIFNWLTGLSMPANIVTARLMSRRYINALLSHQEREVFMAGLWHITGFSQVPLFVKKKSTSESTYSFGKKMALLVNSVTSFSNIPLVLIFHVGIIISIIAMLYIVFLVANRIVLDKPLSGWTSVMASIWLLGGMIISFIGVVGIYLSKIFSETKRRPYTIVKSVYSMHGDGK